MLDESDHPWFLERLWQKIRGEIVQTVPEEIALCEFDCRETSCSAERWRKCQRRISKAEGELKPGLDCRGDRGERPVPNAT